MHGHILDDGWLYVDNTLLKAEATCQTKATLRMMLDLAPLDEAVPLACGRAIHTALEAYFRTNSKPYAMAAFANEYGPWWQAQSKNTDFILRMGGDDKVARMPRAYPNVYDVVSHWIDTHPIDDLPFHVEPSMIETSFQVVLDPEEKIMFTGKADLGKVVLKTDRSKWILDHKSFESGAQFGRGFKITSQMSGYLWGMQKLTGEQYTGCFINGIHTRQIPTSASKCKEHGVQYAECGTMHLEHVMLPVQRTQEQLEAWRLDAIYLARRYKARLLAGLRAFTPPWTDMLSVTPQEGKFNDQCKWCESYEFCSSGQQKQLIPVLFKRHPWDPSEHDRSAAKAV